MSQFFTGTVPLKFFKAKAHPTKRDVYVAFNSNKIESVRSVLDNDQSHPTKLRNDRVQSAYSDRINARLQMAPNRGSTNHRPKSLNSPPSGKSEIRNRQPEVGLNRKWSIDCSALFNSNSSSSTNQNRTWQKSGSTSSLDNILTYNHNIQNQNDFNFDDDSNFQGTFLKFLRLVSPAQNCSKP